MILAKFFWRDYKQKQTVFTDFEDNPGLLTELIISSFPLAVATSHSWLTNVRITSVRITSGSRINNQLSNEKFLAIQISFSNVEYNMHHVECINLSLNKVIHKTCLNQAESLKKFW